MWEYKKLDVKINTVIWYGQPHKISVSISFRRTGELDRVQFSATICWNWPHDDPTLFPHFLLSEVSKQCWHHPNMGGAAWGRLREKHTFVSESKLDHVKNEPRVIPCAVFFPDLSERSFECLSKSVPVQRIMWDLWSFSMDLVSLTEPDYITRALTAFMSATENKQTVHERSPSVLPCEFCQRETGSVSRGVPAAKPSLMSPLSADPKHSTGWGGWKWSQALLTRGQGGLYVTTDQVSLMKPVQFVSLLCTMNTNSKHWKTN